MDDTIALYDPVEAIAEISEATQVDPRTVAQILEGEFDYLGCLGLLDETTMDAEQRQEIDSLRRGNEDILSITEGEYEPEAAVLFIQRNRGIDKETIGRVLQANFRFMDERGFLSEDWGEKASAPSADRPSDSEPAPAAPAVKTRAR